MTLYLSAAQVLRIHEKQIQRFGGAAGLRDGNALDSAVARPQMTFGGEDLYPDVAAKAAALLHSLVQNHPFVDGNKRVGAMAAELFLIINSYSVLATNRELEAMVFSVARGEMEAEAIAIWFRQHGRQIDS